MSLYVSIIKKHDDDTEAIFKYGEINQETGELLVNKKLKAIRCIKPSNSKIDLALYLAAAARIKKIANTTNEFPNKIVYTS